MLNALVYFLAGEGYAGEKLAPVRSGQLVVFAGRIFDGVLTHPP